MIGKIHVYCGNGKGKTTAAIGLAIRCSGSNKRVLFVSFLKNGTSSEIVQLDRLPNIDVAYCEKSFGFTFSMDEKTKQMAQAAYTSLFQRSIKQSEHYDMIILDEIMAACNANLVAYKELLKFIQNRPEELEIVLTGRNPAKEILEAADYITNMSLIKHPYETEQLKARKGIEY